jgi:anti-anti-sigma factor
LVYRLDDRLFFANSNYVRGRILEALDGATTHTHWFVLDAEGIPSIDSTGTGMLEQLLEQLEAKDIQLAVARAKAPLLDAFAASGLTDQIDSSNIYPNVEAAVHACAARIADG